MTTKSRLSTTCEPEIVALIEKIAKKHDASKASIVRQLLLEALEAREDIVLAEVVKERMKDTSPGIPYDQAWQYN